MAKPPHAVYFTRVAAVAVDHLVLSGHLQESPDQRSTRIAEYKSGQWSHLADVPEIVASLSVERVAGQRIVFIMLRNGVTHRLADGVHAVEVIDEQRRLFFSELRGIGGTLFACGAGRQVFRNEGGRWRAIDDGIFIDPTPGREEARRATASILTSLDGYAADDVVAVGTGGVILRHQGTSWSGVESPTNLGIMRVRCYPNAIYACGYHQLFLRGSSDGWRILSHEHGKPPLLDLAMFDGRLYAASEFGLFWLDGETLREVDVPFESPVTFGSLAVTDSHLISVGGENILTFDGVAWNRVDCPWNRDE
jgi:hypothetical protein